MIKSDKISFENVRLTEAQQKILYNALVMMTGIKITELPNGGVRYSARVPGLLNNLETKFLEGEKND